MPDKTDGHFLIDELGPVGTLFAVRLQRVNYQLERAIVPIWANHRLRTGSIGSMGAIIQYPGISQNDVARGLMIDKSTVNAIINDLERLGWAERRPSPKDRRRHALHATPDGEATFAEMMRQVRVVERKLLAQMQPDQLDSLLVLLDAMHASCAAGNAKGKGDS